MNKSSSSSSSSPPRQPPLPTQTHRTTQHRPTTTATSITSSRSSARRRPTPSASIIPVEYNYQTMAPAPSSFAAYRRDSSASTYRTRSTVYPPRSGEVDIELEMDTQYSSLFGDPVPPPPPKEFLGSSFETGHSAAAAFRNISIELSSGGEETYGRPGRLFSNVPYSSSLSRRISQTSQAESNFDVLSSTVSAKLQPPDIQILPNSSGGSSSDQRDSPNYALLTPDQGVRQQPSLYDITEAEPADVSEMVETVTISDATGTREYSEATRRVSNFSEDFKANVGALSNISMMDVSSMSQQSYNRQDSNESYSSTEWFRPAMHDFPEFSKIPRLRPSSKNVMSIKRDQLPPQDSPVAAMLNDSNGSSSAEERLLDLSQALERPLIDTPGSSAPARPPDPLPSRLRDLDAELLLSPQPYLKQRRKSSTDERASQFLSPPPPKEPPPLPPPVPPTRGLDEREDDDSKSLKREMSPVIFKDSIATGSDYRVDEFRLHKKTSFTIISDRSPQSSRAQSPTASPSPSKSSASKLQTPKHSPVKPIAKPRQFLQRKSLTTTQLKLPQLSLGAQAIADDSPRPSVQFDMSGRYSPLKIPQKGILQHRESLTSSLDTLPRPPPPPAPARRNSLLPPPPPPPPSTSTSTSGPKMKRNETLPLITDPHRSGLSHLPCSTWDIRREEVTVPPGAVPRALRPNPNPTRAQRGLLRVIHSADNLSRIPLPVSWASMEELSVERKPSVGSLKLQNRRRSSSTSPERRSSTQTTSDRRSSYMSSITTASDFSFYRPQKTSQPMRRQLKKTADSPRRSFRQRRQSIVPEIGPLGNRTPRTRISKPSTLSPIIGTPNKDSSSPQSPAHSMKRPSMATSETASDLTSRRSSLSRIPIFSHNNSRSNSRLSSHPGSRVASRSVSPHKDSLSPLPSRSHSRATIRSDSRQSSRINSRAPSRSDSRASTRPLSRNTSRGPSRAGSRPSSRMDLAKELANARSDSRLSVRSSIRGGSISPSMGSSRRATSNRRKSISLSPNRDSDRRRQVERRQSISPTGKSRSRASSRGRSKKTDDKNKQRRNSYSRIPRRSISIPRPSKSPAPKSKVPVSVRDQKRTSTASRGRSPTSASRTPTAARKMAVSGKGTPTSSRKQETPGRKQASGPAKPAGGVGRKTESVILAKKSPGKEASKTPTTTTKRREPMSMSMRKPATAGAGAKNNQTPAQARAKAGGKTPAGKEKDSGKAKKDSGKTATNAKSDGGKGGAAATKDSDSAAKSAVGAVDVTAGGSSTVATVGADAAAIAGGVGGGGMKRQPSVKSLIRMGSRMSLMGKKRSDISLSSSIAELAEEPSEGNDTTAGGESSKKGAQAKSTLSKINSSGRLMTPDGMNSLPAAILEKSQKTLENIQKTVTVATDEIHKTINDNLTDLKSLETDMGLTSDSGASPTPSAATVVENKAAKPGESVSRSGTAEGQLKTPTTTGDGAQKSPAPPSQPIEAAVSVLQATADADSMSPVGNGDAAERNGADDKITGSTMMTGGVDVSAVNGGGGGGKVEGAGPGHRLGSGADVDDAKRRSPDGQGGSTAGSGERTNSQEFLDDKDSVSTSRGCCRFCARLCMPCRRMRCSQCCRRNKQSKQFKDESERPVLSATSSATTTNLEVIDEKGPHHQPSMTGKKSSCWERLNCCKNCKKKKSSGASENMDIKAENVSRMESQPMQKQQQGRCGMCWSRIFCCRSVNRVEAATGLETETKKCCFCIPCRCKKGGRGSTVGSVGERAPSTGAWQDPERGITSTDASVVEGIDAVPKEGCCKRFWGKLLCCRKKAPKPSESRRASIKQPTPAEDTRRKLHVDLVEYSSKMKGAIPVLPLSLAWFCAICNTLVPGLGTLFSGFFCLCFGIPRFSQFDSAKARVGAFIINIIVAVSQLFCVLFCFVGWGWSIWWGAIMLKCAKKLSKIRKVERLEMEEEQRQAEAAAAAELNARATLANQENAEATTKT